MRAFHQFGIEIFGTMSATADAEVIALADAFIKRAGLTDVKLHINSIGCPTCRPTYNETLKAYLKPKLPKLCETCNDRFEKNPMRILDCKVPSCQAELQDAPHMIDALCDECETHFEDVKAMLGAMSIDFTVDTGIVRGLDYYTKTAFEFISEDIGAQSTVCGGGRYDGLIQEVGGPDIPGVGFGMGMERLLLTMQNTGVEIVRPMVNELFILVLGEQAKRSALAVAKRFRDAGIKTEIDHLDRSMKAQFKYANKIEVPYVIILGEDEIAKGIMPLKRMSDGTQVEIAIQDVTEGIAFIKSK
jgi:histidyl-tRNA synthetase